MNCRNRTCLLLLLFFALKGSAQKLEYILSAYSQGYGFEKAHLHLDKPAYAAGETIWFKAYVLDGIVPALQSKTFYIDWIDDKGNVLYHSVSPLIDGTTNGQFDIPLNK